VEKQKDILWDEQSGMNKAAGNFHFKTNCGAVQFAKASFYFTKKSNSGSTFQVHAPKVRMLSNFFSWRLKQKAS